MHFIRRAAFRAATSTSTPFASTSSRAITTTTTTPFALRSNVHKASIPSTAFRRFASNDSSEGRSSSIESDDSNAHGAVRSAIGSAAESVSTYTSDAAESIANSAEQAKDSFVDGASATAGQLGFTPRQDRRDSRPSYGDRSYGDRSYGDRSYGDRSYGDRSYGDRSYGDRSGGRSLDRGSRNFGDRPALVPCPNIYIGNLLFDVASSDLEREFATFGTVKKAVVATDARGLSKGFGYVEFETTEQATAAIEAKHQSIFEGRRLIVNYQSATRREPTKPSKPSKTLFIGNLAFEMSDADLNKLFRDIRNVIDVRVAIDRRTGQPRGFAHADFVDVESAVKGLEALSGKEIYGRRLRVDYSSAATNTNRRDSGRDSDRERDDRTDAAY